jgi:uncharacterized membrane protein YvlD (DUF360 family)
VEPIFQHDIGDQASPTKEISLSTLFGLLIAVTLIGLASGFILWIVSELKLGFELDRTIYAFILAIFIAFIGGLLTLIVNFWLIQDGQGLVGGIIHLLITALTLVVSGRILPGVTTSGFMGVFVAAVAIGAFYWLGGLVLGSVFG